MRTAAIVAAALCGGATTRGAAQTLDQLVRQFGGGEAEAAPVDPFQAAAAGGATAAAPTPIINDPHVQPAQYSDWDVGVGPAPVMIEQPANWISGPYMKTGVAVGLGGGFFDDQVPGFNVTGGFRAPLGPALDERLFLDVGGSYLSLYGDMTHAVNGRQVVNGEVIIVPDAFDAQLKEVKRAMAHLAFGRYWGDVLDNRGDDPQWRVATRFGGRVGHVRGRFDVEPSISGLTPDFGKTDTTGGLFCGIEAIYLARRTTLGNMAWTVDCELANDWMKFNNWDSGNIGTASFMLGFMVTR